MKRKKCLLLLPQTVILFTTKSLKVDDNSKNVTTARVIPY
jgi:hypothetical protein